MSRSDLPSLPALRSFAVFVRLGTVQAAADELHVTPGAVTFQLRALEQQLGLKLLERRGRSLRLTEEGRAYGYRVRQALKDLVDATDEVRAGRDARGRPTPARQLRVAVLPSFAMGWLLPRLEDFARSFPDVRLALEASVDTVNLAGRRLDCAVRFGHGNWPGTVSTPLMGDRLLVVRAPGSGLGGDTLAEPRRRLHSSENWGAWAASAGVRLDTGQEPVGWEFNDSSLQLEAARLGLGLALTRRTVADAALRRGDLVPAHRHQPAHPSAYYLLRPAGRPAPSALLDFAQWLQSACRGHAQEAGLPMPAV